jgi:hypothetical protein
MYTYYKSKKNVYKFLRVHKIPIAILFSVKKKWLELVEKIITKLEGEMGFFRSSSRLVLLNEWPYVHLLAPTSITMLMDVGGLQVNIRSLNANGCGGYKWT